MLTQLDFANFHSSAEDRQRLCRDLVASLKQDGFVRLVNHGIPPRDIDGAFSEMRDFFALPLEQKMKAPHPPTPNPHRGYSAFGVEVVATHSNFESKAPMPLLKDMKESYDIGSDRDALYDNIWPPAGVQDSFQPFFSSFFEACYQVQVALLEALSIGLGLPPETLTKRHADQSNELRLTHYPPVSRSDFSHSTRIATHTDFGTITLLFQDTVGGLQVESPFGSGIFVDVESGGRYECIVNAGDCLQRWTGLHSTRHRVHLPKAVDESPRMGAEAVSEGDDIVDGRFSIAYFAKPDRSAILRPLIDDVSSRTDQEYMTAGEFQQMRISGTY